MSKYKHYRSLCIQEVIRADDEFLQDDCSWRKDEKGIWVGMTWNPWMRPARRAVECAETAAQPAKEAQ